MESFEEIIEMMHSYREYTPQSANFVVLVGGYGGVALWSTEPKEKAKAIVNAWTDLLA